MVKKIFVFLVVLFHFFCTPTNATPEKKFVIVITTYNNAEWCVKNLETIFFQKNPDNTDFYQNYRVIIVDDASVDGNAQYIEHYVSACNQQHRVTLIKNKTRRRAMANLYYALQMCQPDEIAFNYDGDDWLADDQVFNLINTIYQNPEIWITYGSFINWPTNQLGYCKPFPQEYIDQQLFRKKWWMPGQLRTFYAWLFHQVQLKDLFFEGPYFQGQFFPANADLAIYYPMMEMAGNHYQFIPEIIYIRNVATPINDFKANKDVQVLGSKLIREKPVYKHLDGPRIDYFKQYENKKADIILLSQNPTLAQKFIHSCTRLMRNCGTIYVVTENDPHEYDALQSESVQIKPYNKQNFKNIVTDVLSHANDYSMFAFDGILLSHYTDCAECILALERAFAYGFYLGMGTESSICQQTGMPQPMPAINQINTTMFAWAFHYADSGDWRCCNNLAMTLYRTKMLQEQLASIDFTDRLSLFDAWQKVPINLENVGLCFEHAKISYINWY